MIALKLIEDKAVLFLRRRKFRTWSSKGSSTQPRVAKVETFVKEGIPNVPKAPTGIPYKRLTIGIPKEIWPNERRWVSCSLSYVPLAEFDSNHFVRVALTPVVTAALVKKGFRVKLEQGAGISANFRDDEYKTNGAEISDLKDVFNSGRKIVFILCLVLDELSLTPLLILADIILKVRAPLESEVNLFKPNSTLISFIHPGQNQALLQKLAEKELTVFGNFICPSLVLMEVSLCEYLVT